MGAGWFRNGVVGVSKGCRLLKRRRWGFKRAQVGCLGSDQWCRHGSQVGGGGGNGDVATDVVEVNDDGGDSADVATEAGVVDGDGLVGDVACCGAAKRQ